MLYRSQNSTLNRFLPKVCNMFLSNFQTNVYIVDQNIWFKCFQKNHSIIFILFGIITSIPHHVISHSTSDYPAFTSMVIIAHHYEMWGGVPQNSSLHILSTVFGFILPCGNFAAFISFLFSALLKQLHDSFFVIKCLWKFVWKLNFSGQI